MNVYLHELRAGKKSFFGWSIALLCLLIGYMSMGQSFMIESASLKTVLENMGADLLRGLGINMDNFFSLAGFYCYLLTYISLMGAMQAMNLGLNVTSKEIRLKTADFLLTKPATRRRIFLSKVAACLTLLLGTEIVMIGGSCIMAASTSKGEQDLTVFLLLGLVFVMIQWVFLALGLFVGVAARKVKAVMPVTLAFTLGLFMLGMFKSVLGIDELRFVTPFSYCDPQSVLMHERIESESIIVWAAATAILFVAGLVVMSKKDIHAV